VSGASPLDGWLALLFVPADREHRVARALSSSADAVILDLEDGVAPAAKAVARAAACAVLDARAAAGAMPDAGQAPSGPALVVRINAAGTCEGDADLRAIAGRAPAAIVVPKATAAAIAGLGPEGPDVIALVETAAGLQQCAEIARRARVRALMLGAVDLSHELRLSALPHGQELLLARSTLVRDAAAAALRPPLDSPYTDVRDPAGLRTESVASRALGFRGKACLHPDQLDVVREAFSPSPDELAWARRILSAWQGSAADRPGVVAVAGEMVDRPVVDRARRLLAEADDARAGAPA
jgi:citrate lyase beta subunit